LPQQAPLNAPRVHLNPEPLVDGLGRLLGGERGIDGSLLGDKLHHLGGEFVPTSWAAFVQKQAEYAVPLKRGPSLIERRAEEAEGVGGLADRTLVDVNLAQHLVLDLHQVVGVEEAAVVKQRMGDGSRMGDPETSAYTVRISRS
jgi:hypothetical protein